MAQGTISTNEAFKAWPFLRALRYYAGISTNTSTNTRINIENHVREYSDDFDYVNFIITGIT